MKCPICNIDLSPLDLVSRTEHVELCIENGPSEVVVDEKTGQSVIKKNVPASKQRKICPICDKTFQTIFAHFKKCAIKNDVPPNLMLDYWDGINKDVKNPKKFPRDLLDSFVAKCVKEGRIGDQVDFARALSLSMAEGEPDSTELQPSGYFQQLPVTLNDEESQSSNQTTAPSEPPQINAHEVLMQNARKTVAPTSTSRSNQAGKKFLLELLDDESKQANIALRIDRELAATRARRYEEALADPRNNLEVEDDEVVIVDEVNQDTSENDVTKLFFMARLKDCTDSEACSKAECGQEHELVLVLEDFLPYSGSSMIQESSSVCRH